MARPSLRIGVLRGRENSFPDAFIAKVNSMDRGVHAEYIQLGGTKLNEPVPYRVILDRMSHEVPYYSVYLKMAALQGTYCHQQHVLARRRRQVLRLRGGREARHRGAEDGGAAQPRLRRRRHRGEPAQPLAHRLRHVPRLRRHAVHHEAGLRRRLEGRDKIHDVGEQAADVYYALRLTRR